MTNEDTDRYIKLCAAIHSTVQIACADLYGALATKDPEQIRVAAAALRNATGGAQMMAAAINELAQRQ